MLIPPSKIRAGRTRRIIILCNIYIDINYKKKPSNKKTLAQKELRKIA